MIKMILAFILVFFLIAAMLIGFRSLSGVERKFLTKIVLECMLYASLAIGVMVTIVYLF